ncbi:MarR family winged helix-turn-helix transcriptional regulator [Leifsonia poae]|uniref:MarR family transcriptional regulator n=1 Tax=Leifsonia poae TaxID=110933 RepID=A0A9W6H739_9MICO|nr:MarR family winged helix-turn-helix transcriptional regulator [Leifsonia poae]GLJ75186.1 MarR family transcriptional regulator [Leifsonia poae]
MTGHDRASSIATVQEELTTIARRGTARVRRENEALSFVDQSLLSYIAANPGCRAIDIASHFQHNRSTVSRQLGALAEFGLITSADAESGRARGQALRLTPAGEASIRTSSETLLTALTERFAGWSADEIEAFARMLQRYNDISEG